MIEKNRAHSGRFMTEGGAMVIRFELEFRGGPDLVLEYEAARRGMTEPDLLGAVFGEVIRSDLFDAVLGDAPR